MAKSFELAITHLEEQIQLAQEETNNLIADRREKNNEVAKLTTEIEWRERKIFEYDKAIRLLEGAFDPAEETEAPAETEN